MHPVGYLFEDIYRNYWGIASALRERKPTLRDRLRAGFASRHR